MNTDLMQPLSMSSLVSDEQLSLLPPSLHTQESAGSMFEEISLTPEFNNDESGSLSQNSNKSNNKRSSKSNIKSTKKRGGKQTKKGKKSNSMNIDDDIDSQSDQNSNNTNENSSNSGSPPNAGKPISPDLKCIWCENPRARNDLCNRCRQKVESRARKLNEQKIIGEQFVVKKVVTFINKHCDYSSFDNLSSKEYGKLFVEIYPFLLLRYQADNTYRGKRNNSCWNVAESTLRILMGKFYGGGDKVPKLNGKSMSSLKRKELCQILENTAFDKIDEVRNKTSNMKDESNNDPNRNKDNNSQSSKSTDDAQTAGIAMSGLSGLQRVATNSNTSNSPPNNPESPDTEPLDSLDSFPSRSDTNNIPISQRDTLNNNINDDINLPIPKTETIGNIPTTSNTSNNNLNNSISPPMDDIRADLNNDITMDTNFNEFGAFETLGRVSSYAKKNLLDTNNPADNQIPPSVIQGTSLGTSLNSTQSSNSTFQSSTLSSGHNSIQHTPRLLKNSAGNTSYESRPSSTNYEQPQTSSISQMTSAPVSMTNTFGMSTLSKYARLRNSRSLQQVARRLNAQKYYQQRVSNRQPIQYYQKQKYMGQLGYRKIRGTGNGGISVSRFERFSPYSGANGVGNIGGIRNANPPQQRSLASLMKRSIGAQSVHSMNSLTNNNTSLSNNFGMNDIGRNDSGTTTTSAYTTQSAIENHSSRFNPTSGVARNLSSMSAAMGNLNESDPYSMSLIDSYAEMTGEYDKNSSNINTTIDPNNNNIDNSTMGLWDNDETLLSTDNTNNNSNSMFGFDNNSSTTENVLGKYRKFGKYRSNNSNNNTTGVRFKTSPSSNGMDSYSNNMNSTNLNGSGGTGTSLRKQQSALTAMNAMNAIRAKRRKSRDMFSGMDSFQNDAVDSLFFPQSKSGNTINSLNNSFKNDVNFDNMNDLNTLGSLGNLDNLDSLGDMGDMGEMTGLADFDNFNNFGFGGNSAPNMTNMNSLDSINNINTMTTNSVGNTLGSGTDNGGGSGNVFQEQSQGSGWHTIDN